MINNTPNSLIKESSPYLLQHAYNPVNWLSYSDYAFEKAKQENKIVLISIGYSACHWCHVMEHESFEDEQVAQLMNNYFINIKVDREERTDVDMLYMQAVQLMTGQGGWPLNCFTLPNGKPIYGGTYFNKQQWLNVLNNLADLYQNNTIKVEEYAENLTNGIKKAELLNVNIEKSDNENLNQILLTGVEKWKIHFDYLNGGPNRAPKFPLPNNYLFLLNYATQNQATELLNHVNLTLTKMANGGIFDHLNGGFARYSVDEQWKVPHFEKMLYDNAQLAILYCKAYIKTDNILFKQTAIKTLNFIKHEWFNEGYFYSALDADSDGVEGKYYVWEEEELRKILKEDYNLFSEYFQINNIGYWEDEKYILIKKEDVSTILVNYNLSLKNLDHKINECILKLKEVQLKRIKPGLDDKSVCAWNAMAISAFCEGYLSFNIENYKNVALKGIDFLLNNFIKEENLIYRIYKTNTIKIKGFLDDYAFTIEALINVYKISCNENYLLKAKELCNYVLTNFINPNSHLLFYSQENNLILQTTEVSDNVIPSSNSQMANNFYEIGRYFNEEIFITKAVNMLTIGIANFNNYGAGYSNWAILAHKIIQPQFEITIVGNNVNTILLELYKYCPTYPILAVSKQTSSLPLIKDKFSVNETLIYVCKNKHCYLPVSTVNEAINYFEN